MKVGTARLDITPSVGVELCGYAARTQPSVGVMDPLFAKALYVEAGGERFLWIVTDLIAMPREEVLTLRTWAKETLGLESHQVMVSATHTHSGPATVQLNAAGRRDTSYMGRIQGWLRDVSREAVARVEDCELVTAEAQIDIAVDRRKQPTAHTDPRALGLGFRRRDGTFIAALLNYAMHPVMLGHVNRMVSGDWCGYAAEALTETLAGAPMGFVVNGACGNLNPPGEGRPRDEVRDLGRRVASAVIEQLQSSPPAASTLSSASATVAMPMDVLTPEQIDRVAQREVAKIGEGHPWFIPIRDAIETWKTTMKAAISTGQGATVEIELHALNLGGVTVMGVNCEMFSRFVDGLRQKLGPRIYVAGYTNGGFGYVAHSAAYDEGGYEVDSAHFFYNTFRPRRGAMEHLCQQAAEIATRVQ